MTKRSDGIVSSWLRAETPEHLEMLTKLRKRLVDTMPSETTPDGTPNRDWCRAFQRYQNGYQMLLVEERERAKLALVARLKGQGGVLTDDEYEQGIRDLGIEAVAELDTADLVAELTKRGLTLPAAPEDEQ